MQKSAVGAPMAQAGRKMVASRAFSSRPVPSPYLCASATSQLMTPKLLSARAQRCTVRVEASKVSDASHCTLLVPRWYMHTNAESDRKSVV